MTVIKERQPDGSDKVVGGVTPPATTTTYGTVLSPGSAAGVRGTLNMISGTKTSPYALSVWDSITCDVSSGSFTQALPTPTALGQEVEIFVNYAVTANTLVVSGTGGPFSIQAGHGVTFRWNGSVWSERQDRKTKASLDAAYKFFLNAKEYGARGDGITDDLAALTAAITACNAAGGGVVHLTPGIYMLSGRLDVLQNVTLQGSGLSNTTLRSTAVASNPTLRMRGDSDVIVQDLTVDASGRTNSIGVVVECVSTSTVAARHSFRRCGIVNTTNNALRMANHVFGFTFRENEVSNCTAGISNPGTTGNSTSISIEANRFRNVGGTNIQLHQNGSDPSKIYSDVQIKSNDLGDFYLPASTIPIEIGYTNGLVIDGNTIRSAATRGISTGNNTNVVISNNRVTSQTFYAIEFGNTQKFAVTGNVAENCNSFLQETGGTTSDGLIANNTYMGSGATSTQTGVYAIKLPWASRVKVANNFFGDWQYLAGGIYIGGSATAADIGIEGNTFVVSDANSNLQAVYLRKCVRTNVSHNTVRVNRNLVAGDDYISTLAVFGDAAATTIAIHDNDIVFSGTVSAASHASGIGDSGSATNPLPGLSIYNNKVANGPIGIRLRISSTDLMAYSNETGTCTSLDDLPATASIAPIPSGGRALAASGTLSNRDGTVVYTITSSQTQALPSPTAVTPYKQFTLKNKSTSTASLYLSTVVDGVTNVPINPGESLSIMSDGSAWMRA